MDDRRCPFCGGMLLDKICVDCGYEYLTEEEIAAPYDFSPDNDCFGAAEEKTGTGMEGITLESLDGDYIEMPQVASLGGSGVVPPKSRHFQNPNSVPLNNNVNVTKAPNYTPPTPTPTPPPPVQQNMSVFEMVVKDLSNYVQKYWWQILLTIIAPTSAIFIGMFYVFTATGKNSTKSGMDKVTSIAIGVIYIIIGFVLKLNNFDLFGLDAILDKIMEMLPRRHRYRY